MGHTHRYLFGLKKKKSGKESQYLVSRPGLGSDPPIGSDRDSGRDNYDTFTYLEIFLMYLIHLLLLS